MKLIRFRSYLQFAMAIASLVLMCGCGSGSGTVTNDTASKVASVSVSSSGNGEYILQGTNLDGVAGIDLTLQYDTAVISSPAVTQSTFTSGAMLVSNTNVPGIIRIAMISVKALSGSGQIAAVTFATQSGAAGIRSITVSMVDIKGAVIPCKASLI